MRTSRRWRLLLRPLLYLVVALVAARLLVSIVGSVDWGAVSAALERLSWSDVPLLVALLLAREAFNSIPLAVFVPRLGFARALQNDLAARVVAFLAPPPGDVVLRISMFRSWGIPAGDGLPGVTLNSLTFYVIRFSVPLLGLLLLLGEEDATTRVWLSVVSILIAAAVVAGLVLVSRGERMAAWLGHRAGRIAQRVREDVDPEEWSEAVQAFRAQMSTRLVRGLPASLLALLMMVVCDGLIVVVALRVVGVDSGLLGLSLVLGTFLVAYPLTALPLSGLGVLDAVLVVGYTEAAGTAAESAIVAALIIWRVVTLPGSLALGAGALGLWKLKTKSVS